MLHIKEEKTPGTCVDAATSDTKKKRDRKLRAKHVWED